MLRYELRRIPLTRYMMLYLDWKKVSLHHRILLLHGMEKTIRLKHGTLIRPLQSAMASSVNWYFQSVDEQLGTTSVYDYIKEIGYGNKNMSGDFSTYWMESSLKISPIEQVELLTQLQNNNFGFAPQNINAVKDSICLSSSDAGTFYGKTGTGRVDGQDVNGWFIGYIETADNTYFLLPTLVQTAMLPEATQLK